MLKQITEPILMKPKSLEANTVHCSMCAGVGWLYDDEKGIIAHCWKCGGSGLNRVCKYCGEVVSNYYSKVCDKKECRDKKYAEDQAEREQKETEYEEKKLKLATVVSYEECPEEYKGMMYSRHYHGNEGFFEDFEELVYSTGNELPEYVWATNVERININAKDVIDNACENLWEEAYDQIDKKDINELQEYLNKWCEKQIGTDTYSINYKYAIKVPIKIINIKGE